MSRFTSLVSLFTLAGSVGLVGGCVVVHEHPGDRPVPVTCNVPGPVTYTANFPSFHVLVNASTVIAAGDRGFAVTSNGSGTYRLTWSDTSGAATCFTGRVTGLDNFNASQVTGFSGLETISLISPNQIGFASVPGAGVDGVDFFAQQDPVYVDVYADNSQAVNIYYTDGASTLVETTGANPAAFLSP